MNFVPEVACECCLVDEAWPPFHEVIAFGPARPNKFINLASRGNKAPVPVNSMKQYQPHGNTFVIHDNSESVNSLRSSLLNVCCF